MECKVKKLKKYKLNIAGFNRYIVECKGCRTPNTSRCRKGFNRYIVECKAAILNGAVTGETDLIDTLWNVKYGNEIKTLKFKKDLIDTLWNVKGSGDSSTHKRSGI